MERVHSSVETPLPELRIPTRLVQRSHLSGRTQEARVIAPGVLSLVRVGPYDVVRGLVRAPSAWLAEARGPNGEAVLLQIAHLRAAHGRVDLLHRQHLERAIAKATVDLFSEAEFAIMAHGGADREDGSRALFWALPWRPDAERLIHADLYVEDPGHLVKIGISIAKRLARRHALGRLEPLLNEHLILVEPEGAELCGVPVQVPPAWLTADSPVARLSPEEAVSEDVTKLGDIWRFGQALAALAAPFDAVPHALARLLERMTARDEALRPPRVTEVLVELEAIHHGLDRGLELVRLEPSGTNSFATLEPEALGQILVRCLGDSTKVDSAQPWNADAAPVPFVSSPATEEMVLPPSRQPIPPWAFFFEHAELEMFLKLVGRDLEQRGLEHQIGSGVVQISGQGWPAFKYLGLSDLARLCHRSTPTEWAALVARDFDGLLSETPTFDPDLAPTVLRPGSALDVIRRPRRTPLPTLTQAPEPETVPPGALPSIRVVMGAPTQTPAPTPAQTARPAPTPAPVLRKDPTPLPVRSQPPTLTARPVPPAAARSPSPAPVQAPVMPEAQRRLSEATLIDGNSAGPLHPDIAAAAQNRSVKISALVAGGILVLGAVLGISQLVEPAALLATPAHEVVVDATPGNAIVVSERDGRILGPVPQRFLVPEGTTPIVLIAAEGHEPTRLILPDRGRVMASLAPLPNAVDRCALAVNAEDQGAYEGVAAQLDGGSRLVVKGAAVVRTKDGHGAWLVRCPKFGGTGEVALEQAPIPEVRIQVIGPAQSEVSIDGGRVGSVPTSTMVHGAFVEVQITTPAGARIHRWVPALAPTEVQMPSSPQPTALLGLGR